MIVVVCYSRPFVTVTASCAEDVRMLREMRPTASNTADLLEMMARTRGERRRWIENDKPTITAVLKHYPRLQDMNKAVSILIVQQLR